VSASLAAAKKLARVAFPSNLIGALAPTRILVGRVAHGASANGSIAAAAARATGGLLDVPGKESIVLALSKDPNAKLTVLLMPAGGRIPTLAVKVPTTEASVVNIEAERRILLDLRDRLPESLRATIPEVSDLPISSASSMLVAAGLRGTPMSTRYHGWRHVATRAAVQRDFAMVEAWLSSFQSATAGPHAPIDMGSHAATGLRAKFGEDPATENILGRLVATHARLSRSSTPKTAVHGDFWFGNLLVDHDRVSGVIDWECGSICGEPVRDIVRFALTYALYLDRHSPAGARVAGHRGLRTGVWGSGIEFAINGSGWFPDLFRSFVGRGLSRLGADPTAWRDASLAGLAEVAATADHDAFARLHWELFARLSDTPVVDREPRLLGAVKPTFATASTKKVSSDSL
jgi:hypothetical protein